MHPGDSRIEGEVNFAPPIVSSSITVILTFIFCRRFLTLMQYLLGHRCINQQLTRCAGCGHALRLSAQIYEKLALFLFTHGQYVFEKTTTGLDAVVLLIFSCTPFAAMATVR